MATKKSFVLFTDRKKEIDMLSDAQCGVLFKAILRYADTGERLESGDLAVQVLFSVFASQIDSCNEKWEAIKKKRSEAGKKGMESRWGTKPKQEIATDNNDKQAVTNDNNVIGVITSDNKPKQTITKITVTDTVTGTVTVPVTNKSPDGTAPNGAAPPANQEVGDVVPWDAVDFDLV